jgi:hypothetical protein
MEVAMRHEFTAIFETDGSRFCGYRSKRALTIVDTASSSMLAECLRSPGSSKS